MYIPEKIYHATIKSRIPIIKKLGLGGKIPRKRFWDYVGTEYENITVGCFFDSDKNCAYDYVESSEYYEGDESNIVVFEVNTSDLDLSKLSYDRNDLKNLNDDLNSGESRSYFYAGIVPYEKLRKLSYSEIFEMKQDNLYNAIMEKLSVIVKQALNEDSDELTPGEKMDAWHNGERKENIKACDADKLKKYKAICKAKGYDAEVAAIQAEIDKRSLKESLNPEQYLENMDYLIDTYNSEYENDFDAECDYNDFLSHLNYIEEHSNATSYLIIGNLGLWNGRPNIYPILKQYLKDAYKKCVNNMDDVIVKINNTVMEVTGLHHDGRNTFYIVPLNEKGDEDYHNWDSSYDSILEYDDTLTLDKIIAAGLNAQFVW